MAKVGAFVSNEHVKITKGSFVKLLFLSEKGFWKYFGRYVCAENSARGSLH